MFSYMFAGEKKEKTVGLIIHFWLKRSYVKNNLKSYDRYNNTITR